MLLFRKKIVCDDIISIAHEVQNYIKNIKNVSAKMIIKIEIKYAKETTNKRFEPPILFSLFQMYKYIQAPPLMFSMQPSLWFFTQYNNLASSN